MKKLLFFHALFFFDFLVYAQNNENSERPSTFSVSMSQENAFGFYPAVYGSFGLNESMDFTYYGIFWTNPSFGLPQTSFSSDLWLESGIGVGFDALNGTAYINPSLGFTHGKFLSGGSEGIVFDGVVPSVIAYFYPGSFDGEIYIGYYQHLREQSSNTYDLLLYWIYSGIWVSDKISAGIHYEGLFINFAQTKLESSYQWLGLYFKISSGGKYTFRLSGGPNLKEGIYSSEFYKLSVLIPLL